VDKANAHEQHTAHIPALLGRGQASKRGRAGPDGRRWRERIHVPTVFQLRVQQAGPAVSAGPLGGRPVRGGRRPVLQQAEDRQHARLSTPVRRQRTPPGHGIASGRRHATAAAVDHIRRRWQGTGDRG